VGPGIRGAVRVTMRCGHWLAADAAVQSSEGAVLPMIRYFAVTCVELAVMLWLFAAWLGRRDAGHDAPPHA